MTQICNNHGSHDHMHKQIPQYESQSYSASYQLTGFIRGQVVEERKQSSCKGQRELRVLFCLNRGGREGCHTITQHGGQEAVVGGRPSGLYDGGKTRVTLKVDDGRDGA